MRWGIVVEWIHRCKIELKPNEEWKTRTGLSNPPGLPRLPCPPPQACVLKNSATETQTRVAGVRAGYPNQLDYSGLAFGSFLVYASLLWPTTAYNPE